MEISVRQKIHFLTYYTIISTFIGITYSTVTLSPSVTEVVRYVNESYIVTCIAENKSLVKWSKYQSSKAIVEKGHPHILKFGPGTALVFERIAAEDRGNYTCRTGNDEASFKLIVISPITFINTPAIQTAQEHHSATIKCEVRGDPKPKILWRFNGMDTIPSKHKQIPGGLKIENVTLEDKGTYTCKAYQVSEVTSMFEEKNIKLNIQHKPMLPNSAYPLQNEVYGFIGGEVNLTCEAIAEPAANFTWFRQHTKTVIGRLIHKPNTSILKLYIQNESMFGGYMCKATNKLGSLNQIITLQKGIKPPKPQHLKFRSSTSDTITIEIIGPDLNHTQIEPKMHPIIYRLQYRPKGENIKWSEAPVAEFKIIHEDEKLTISGLNHNTDYELRVATRNIAGTSDYTNPIFGNTLGLQADSVIASASSLKKSIYSIINLTLLSYVFL